MISKSFNFYQIKSEIWKIYFSLSVLVGSVFFLISYYGLNNSLSSLFFIVAFTVISFSFRKRVNHEFWFLVELEAVSVCLYMQFICLIAHYYSSQTIGMMFLATIPMLAALVNFNMHQFDRKDTDRFEVLIFISSFIIIGSIVANMSNASNMNGVQWLAFGSFTFWLLASSYFLWSSYQVGQKSFMIHLVRQSHRGEDNSEYEKFLFHDLINQTHGLRLFLESYQMRGEDVEFEKISLLISEIKILQDHLSSHFGKRHKNLESKNLEVSVGFAHLLLENLVKTYLPENRVQVSYLFEEHLNESSFWSQGQIEMHRFHRIVTNLIKNVAEYRSKKLTIEVERANDDLLYTFKNPMNVQENYKNNIDVFLSKSILNEENNKGSGMGLNSVEVLSRKMGGQFEFYIQDGVWVAKLRVPVKISKISYSQVA
jgi:hypothetical protein